MTSPLIIAAAARRDRAADLATAGVDRIVAYHSSAYRDRGLPSVAGLLPWASANEQVLAMLPEVLAGASGTKVITTVCANDGLLPVEAMLEQVASTGAAGVLNAPTTGLLSGSVRDVLEHLGLGMSAEVRLIREAVDRDLEAWAYVFDETWINEALSAGATGLIVHLGITGFGITDPAKVADAIGRWLEPAMQNDVPVLLHGGPLKTPDDATVLLEHLEPRLRFRISGFFGASALDGVTADPMTTARQTEESVQRWRHVFTRDRASARSGS